MNRTFRVAAALSVAAAFAQPSDPVFPYGAVYFRKSSPLENVWEEDHKTAAKVGLNIMRHWYMWSGIEVAPGKYDWSDYDRLMDIEARNKIRVVIAEMITAAPEWAWKQFAHARYEAHDGYQGVPTYSGSAAIGGFPGLCLDNDDARAAAGRFLHALAARYKDHPAMYAYDLWNESNTSGGGGGYFQTASSAHIPNEHRGTGLGRMYCYCPATQSLFREWLKKKYGTLEALGKAWRRYSFAEWPNVEAPRTGGPYPDFLDWVEFREDRAHELLRWRRDLIRSVDKRNKITAHGLAYTVEILPTASANDWRAAAEVETYGFTWVAARKGAEAWKQFHAVDMIRAASRGKPFWHAEFQGGPLWMQAEVTGRPLEDGRKPDEKDVRLWNLVSMAGGIKGLMYVRWRPLIDGPLFGAFAPMAMDGSMTPRSEMAAKFAQWTNASAAVWKSNPVKGDIGIVFVPESERFNYAQQGNTSYYAESARGAYMAFFDSNIQPDWVHIDHAAEYPVVYLPYPVMLSSATAAKLRNYVEQGGMLISEGLPGYFGDGARAGTIQPNQGLDEVFGTREADVEFAPDLFDNLFIRLRGEQVRGRIFRQVFRPGKGSAAGNYADGGVAAVENRYGRGRTLVIGTFPAAAYFRHQEAGTRNFFRGLLDWAKRTRQTVVSDAAVTARLHAGAGGTYLWVINPGRDPKTVTVTLAQGAYRTANRIWGEGAASIENNMVRVSIEGRDGAVMRLE
jgi:beta-galactosidase